MILYHSESDCYFPGELTERDAEQGVIELELSEVPAGATLPAGPGVSTVLADMDWETYSEAGCIWDEAKQTWKAPKGATKKGISAVGGMKYAEHPSTEALQLSYNLKDGIGPRLWIPGMADPLDLFAYIAAGGIIEAWNDSFEYWIWLYIAERRMGWPPLPFHQLRDAMAKARAFTLPGKLEDAAKVTDAKDQKFKDGTRLIQKFSVPRKPTKRDPRRRIRPEEDPEDAVNLYLYGLQDIKAESAVSAVCPDLSPEELEFERYTKAMNVRGTALDMQTVNAAASILDQVLIKYNAELATITGGAAERASQTERIKKWLKEFQGVTLPNFEAGTVDEALEGTNLPPLARRALEIRQLAGSAGVKKIYAMQRMASNAGRAHDMIAYHVARTGRDGGQDIQPQNLVKAGPDLIWCPCGKPFGDHRATCPTCGASALTGERKAWSWQAVPYAVKAIRTGSLDHVEDLFGNALLTLCGCIRGLFVSGEGKDLICSDYSSIEAVVTAVLAGETWRIEAFERKEDIYLVSASRITGIALEEYLAHPDGPKGHPDRQKIGKPAELGLGFGGWIGAWYQFDKSGNFTEDQVKANIIAWRKASPMIVELWGGQVRGLPWKPERFELFGLEGMAIAAIQNPGKAYAYREITYQVKGDALYCRLPSGRLLTYHRPRLQPSRRWDNQLEITFEGWNSNPKMGPLGWYRMQTYGGRLAENVIQATARDFMRDAVPRLERAGYPIVLRVHDELVAEVPEGFGTIEELEHLMGIKPTWATGWPIRAAGGWRAKRYRKD